MKITLAVICAAALIIAAFEQVYIASDGAGATVFLKGDEAYLFLGASSTGWKMSYLQYPIAAAREYFYAPPIPTDDRVATMVVRVTPSGVERFYIEYGRETALAPSFLTPFGDSFYGMCPGMVLCKWAGNEFVPATEDEQQKFGGIEKLFRGDINNHVMNGWSVRQLRSSPGDHFDIQVSEKFTISAKNRAKDVREQPSISVKVLRPGQSPEVLYNVDGAPRRVSRDEYDKTFGRS